MNYIKFAVVAGLVIAASGFTYRETSQHYQTIIAKQAAEQSQRVNDVLQHALAKQIKTEGITRDIQTQYMALQEVNRKLSESLADSVRKYRAASHKPVPAVPVSAAGGDGTSRGAGSDPETEELAGLAQQVSNGCHHDANSLSALQEWVRKQAE